jgi:hypothetical protein
MSSQTEAPLTPSALAAIAQLNPPALEILASHSSHRAALNALLDQLLYKDAVRLLAHLLPKREAVWWAWISVRRASNGTQTPAVQVSLNATEKWLTQPTDENRRAALLAAQEAQISNPAGCVGLAAFFSGGSLAPANAHPVPPDEHLSAKAVANAIILASVTEAPEKAEETLRGFLAQGLEVSERIGLWRKEEK